MKDGIGSRKRNVTWTLGLVQLDPPAFAPFIDRVDFRIFSEFSILSPIS